MTDQALQELRRAAKASPWDLHSQVKLLRARMRVGEACEGACSPVSDMPIHNGTPVSACPRCAGLALRERIELAAYAGSEAARLLWCEWDRSMPNHDAGKVPFALYRARKGLPLKFNLWLQGLTRWGQHVQIRAAVAAARCALPVASLGVFQNQSAVGAIEATAVWLACPCEEHYQACAAASATLWSAQVGLPPTWAYVAVNSVDSADQAARAIQAAAQLVPEPTLRAAICEALVSWALG